MANVADADALIPSRPRSTAEKRARRTRLQAIYILASFTWVLAIGLPLERVIALSWLFGLLAISVVTEGPDRLAGLTRDWAGFAALLVVYRYSAGLADSFDRPVMAAGLADIDRLIGFGEVPSVRLQNTFDQTGRAPWWQVPLSFVYVSHFFGILIAAAWLWLKDRPAWIRYTKRLLTVAALAVTTYVVLPAAPPWMAAEQGVIPMLERTPLLGWERIGLGILAPVIEQGRAVANPVAALPSMHAGFALLIAWFFWTRVGLAGRMLLAMYPMAMGFTLVLTGEHWVADLVLGWVYVAAVMSGWTIWENRKVSTNPDLTE